VFLEEAKLTTSDPTTQVDSSYNVMLVKLNRNAIFYSDPIDKSYRGIKGSIQLSEILSIDDAPEEGNCCKSIGEIFKSNILIVGL
jgi:hypothetical protein